MQYYKIELIDWKDGRIDAFHADMFHGLASRNGCESPHNEFYDVTSKLLFPLDIERNGVRIPDITRPAENLVVSHRVRERLKGLPGIAFYQVRFLKLFHYPWKVGDFSHYNRPGEQLDMTHWEFFETLPDVPEYHRGIEPYYELLNQSPVTIRTRYAFSESSDILMSGFPFSPRILRESSVLDAERGCYLTQEVYTALAPYLDKDFYECRELTT